MIRHKSSRTSGEAVRPVAPSKILNISCKSDDDKALVHANFQKVKDDLDIRKLEIHNMVVSDQKSTMVDAFREILLAKDREWEAIEMRDEFELIQYGGWKDKVDKLMTDCKESEGDSSWCEGMTFRAAIAIQEGLSIADFMGILKAIKEEAGGVIDASIQDDDGDKIKPSELVFLFQEGSLRDPVVLKLKCGWSEAQPAYKRFLNCCLCRLNEVQREQTKQAKREKARKKSRSPKRTKSGSSLPGLAQKRNSSSSLRGLGPKKSSSNNCLPELQKSLTSDTSPRSRRRSSSRSLGRALTDFHNQEPRISRAERRGRRAAKRSLSPKEASPSEISQQPEGSQPSTIKRNLTTGRPIPTKTISLQRNATTGKSPTRRRVSPSSAIEAPPASNGDQKELKRQQRRDAKGSEAPRSTSSEPNNVDSTKTNSEPEEAQFWRSAVDAESGLIYYYHKKTKVTQWTKPSCLSIAESSDSSSGREARSPKEKIQSACSA